MIEDAREEEAKVHQRHKIPTTTKSNSYKDDPSPIVSLTDKDKTVLRQRKQYVYVRFVGFTAVFFILFFVGVKYLSRLVFLRCVTFLPVLLSLFTTIQRGKQLQQRLIPAALVVTVLSAQLPTYIAAAIASLSIVLFSLLSRGLKTNNKKEQPNNNDDINNNNATFTSVVASILLMITVLLVENFLIWVVSATFIPGQLPDTAPPPLQDNGQNFLKGYIYNTLKKKEVVNLRRIWNTQWSLVACMGASLIKVEIFSNNRSLFGVAQHAVLTVAFARFIRTVSFLLTVVPSQVQNCYKQRFPYPVPNDTIEWIWVGIIPRSHGGCNDLIISGHAIITTTMACVSTSVSGDLYFSIALWCMVILDYSVEIYEGFHYSVDMWLGMILASLIWRILSSILEGNITVKDTTNNSNNIFKTQQTTVPSVITIKDIVLYVPPALVSYMQIVFLPESTANLVILSYLAVMLIFTYKFIWNETDQNKKEHSFHYCQHMMICLLLMALGIYL